MRLWPTFLSRVCDIQITLETDLIRSSNFGICRVDRYRGHRPIHGMGPIDQETNALDNRHLNSDKNHDAGSHQRFEETTHTEWTTV